MSRPLVFVSCGNTTAPLVPHLMSRYTIVAPDAEAAETLNRQGARAIGWETFVDPARVAALSATAERVAGAWQARLARSPLDDALRRTVAECVRARVPELLAAHECGRALAASGRLAAVCVHEDVTGPVRALVAGVRPSGVPSVHVPHGLYPEERVVGANVHGTVHADLVAVGGAVQHAWFRRRGVAPERLVVTGNPAWDHLCRLPRLAPGALGLPAGPVVCLATSWIGRDAAHTGHAREIHDEILRAGLGAVHALRRTEPALRLVLKLHPSTPAAEETRLRAMAAELGVAIDLVAHDRLPAILAASDLLVTGPSTIAVEALLAGTPVIAVKFLYAGEAVLAAPADAAAIAALAARVLGGWGRSAEFARRRREFAALYDGPADGRAAERVAALVADLAARAPAREAGKPLAAEAVVRGLLRAGRFATALAVLDDARAPVDPAAGGAWCTVRGTTLVHLGRCAEAEVSFRTAIGAGAGAEAHARLGSLLLERGARLEAAVELERATALDPECDLAWSGLGVLAALDGEDERAVACLERALALDPASPDAHAALVALGRRPVQEARAGA